MMNNAFAEYDVCDDLHSNSLSTPANEIWSGHTSVVGSVILPPPAFQRLRLLHGTQHHVDHFAGAGKLQQEMNKRRDIGRLDQAFRRIWPSLRRKDRALELSCRSSKENRRDAYAIAVDFISQTICQSFHGVLGCGVLADSSGSFKPLRRIDEYDLPLGSYQQRQ